MEFSIYGPGETNEYLKANNPEKLKFNPTVIKIQNDQLTFGMGKHYGSLVMKLKTMRFRHDKLIKYTSLTLSFLPCYCVLLG